MGAPGRTLDLTVETWDLAVAQLGPDAALPDWATRGAFHAVVRSPGELTVVGDAALVPAGVRAQKGWRCFSLPGPIAFTETGIVASIAVPLAAAGIGLFVISTFDTDYVLVAGEKLDAATAALGAAGHRVRRR
jgi:hypothetical protein